MPSKARLKCYFQCDGKGPLHRFPKPEYPHLEKFKSWKAVLDKATQERGDVYIYNQVRFCDKHFEECFRSASHRLTSNAIPTLILRVPEIETNNLDNTRVITQRTEKHTNIDKTHVNLSTVQGSRETIPSERSLARKRKNVNTGNDLISKALNMLDETKERDPLHIDDLSAFGNYVVSTLGKLNARNSLAAQNEIYSILSRYKLHEEVYSEATASISGAPFTPQSISKPLPESTQDEFWLEIEFEDQ